LAGLIDSDGYRSQSNYYEIFQKSKELAEDIEYLALSLGFMVTVTEVEKGYRAKNEEMKMGNYYRISIFGEGIETIPVLLDRKKCQPRIIKKRANCLSFQVESLGVGDYNGFELDGNGRFLLGDFTVTHNTTISRLLCRFYDCDTGSILVNGEDVRHVTQISLRRSIGVVPQDTVLFNDTLLYNIKFGGVYREEESPVTQEQIERATKEANIYDFILSTPDGFSTKVGERGLRLSGGEKQRVAIARTILKDPPILILDEATSALDSKTEKEIQSSLMEVSKGRTTLIVAHRLSTIMHADEILVLKAGQIVERGTHRELLDKAGEYQAMWDIQAKEQSPKAPAEVPSEPSSPIVQ